jgi:pimeloyl-[acyl-carrier protein] methyl ester esterase
MSIPLLFLHGWAMRGAVFDDLAARLGVDFDCHAPDLPGHATRSTEPPRLKRCVAVTHEAIEQLDRPILVGWSMGAAVAWRYIAQHGTQTLRGLVTIDMSPRLLPDHDWHFGLLEHSAEQTLATSVKIEPHWTRMVGNILRNMYAPGDTPQDDGDALRNWLLAQDPATLRPLWDDLVALDERQTIPRINVPYLVCAGAQSRLYDPDVARWIAGQSPKAHVAIFDHSGHSPHLEEPEAFCDAIRRFVAAHPDKAPKTGAVAPR